MRRPDRVNAHSRQADEPEAESLAEWVKATKGKHYEQYCNEMEKNRVRSVCSFVGVAALRAARAARSRGADVGRRCDVGGDLQRIPCAYSTVEFDWCARACVHATLRLAPPASESNYYSEHLPRAPAAARAERTIWLCHVLECHYGSVHPIGAPRRTACVRANKDVTQSTTTVRAPRRARDCRRWRPSFASCRSRRRKTYPTRCSSSTSASRWSTRQ